MENTISQCGIDSVFFHSVLGIKKYLRRSKELVKEVQQKLWNLYQATNKRQFAQRLRRLQEWATPEQLKSDKAREKIQKLTSKLSSNRQDTLLSMLPNGCFNTFKSCDLFWWCVSIKDCCNIIYTLL
jgi:hypothetical protein